MRDIIQDRLNKINDLNDRRFMKKILYDVFDNVVLYNMDMYKRLEKRIYDEIEDPLNKFYIYTCLEKVENIDPVNDFLHPIIPADLDDTVYDMNEINEKLQNNQEFIVTSIFLKCDNLTFREILKRRRYYKGYVKTNQDVHEIEVSLRECRKYIDEIEKLYRVFQYNKIIWSTLNCPYAYKYVDIILNSSILLKPDEKITEIIIDLAEYEKYKEINAIPLWNIKKIEAEDKSFPMPAKDRINFDHVISLEEFGVQNGYLVGIENVDYIYCKRLEKDLVIVSPNDNQHKWSLLQIEDINNSKQSIYNFELLSNNRNLGFIGRYSNVKSMIIRTKGEIARLVQCYELSKELLFQNAEVRDSYKKIEQTINFNDFIDDNIRVDDGKKILLLKFKPYDRENYLIYDKMSFLISELQILFPEYKCIGELV